jgi:hypothetical protein
LRGADWRPTRQHFDLLRWLKDHARLDIAAGEERPYIRNFLEARDPPAGKSKRKNKFPHDPQELVLATAWRLVEDGQDVLVFCSQRNSVELLAKKALKLGSKDFCSPF